MIQESVGRWEKRRKFEQAGVQIISKLALLKNPVSIPSWLLLKLSWSFDLRKSLHHHTIQINQPTRCNNFTSLLLEVYVWFNMFRAPLCPSSGAYNCTRSLWFYRQSVAVGALLVVVQQVTCQTTTNNAPTATLQRQNQRLLVQLYAPDDGRRGARNMLNHT